LPMAMVDRIGGGGQSQSEKRRRRLRLFPHAVGGAGEEEIIAIAAYGA